MYQRTPQVLFPLPVHDLAAACAELCRLGRMVSDVDGTRTDTNAIHMAVMPLKRISLLLHASVGSQRVSLMTPLYLLGKKVSIVTFNRPLTASSHVLEFVFVQLVS